VDEQGGVKVAASTAGDKTRELAHDASAHAGDLAGSVKEHAGDVGHEVVEQGRRVVEDAKVQVRQQADTQTRQAVSALRQWSDRGRALAEGRADEAGPLADYAREMASKVSGVADRFEQRGFDGVLEDVKSFARRRPGMFLVGAGVAGFAVGRMVRGAKSASASNGTSQPAIAAPSVPYTPPAVSGGAPTEPVVAQPAISEPAITEAGYAPVAPGGASGQGLGR
jgi:hypothetical protein